MIFLFVTNLVLLFALLYIVRVHIKSQEKAKKDIQAARDDSVNKSRHTITGHIVENMAPLLPGYPYSGRDSKHLGSPFDYVVIDGMSDCRDSNGVEDVREIVFVDIKTGKSQLTLVERRIKKAIEEGRVRWETLRFNENSLEKSLDKPRKQSYNE